MLIEYQLRIRNAANTADALVVTSVRGGTNPYLSTVPKGDGTTIDPRTGDSMLGVYSGELADADIGAMQRVLTSKLEDAGGRQQLGLRRAVVESRNDGGVIVAGGAFVVGRTYTIVTVGTTDFTLIGAASNTVGLCFTATGVGAGSGTAARWETLISGLLTHLRLVDGISWEYTVSDPMHAQMTTQLFSPVSSTLITDFLAAWPTRGCVLGGPVIGGTYAAFGIADLGGWTMRVELQATGGGTEYILRPVIVYGPGNWVASERTRVPDIADPINNAVSAVQLPQSDGAADSWSTIEDASAHAWAWQGLTMLIDGVPWKPLVSDYATDGSYQLVGNRMRTGGGLFHNDKDGDYGIKVKSDGVRTLVNGALVRVRALTVLPTEISPLYLKGHPVDLLTQFWTAGGRSYNAAACATLKSLLGSDASFGLRITSARALADLVNTVCQPFGIGLRGNDAGEIEPFDARLGRASADPVTTITSADVVIGTVQPFDFDPGAALKTITFRAKQFRANIISRVIQGAAWFQLSRGNIVDSINISDIELTVVDGDPGAVPYGDFELSTEGMVHAAAAFYPSLRDFWIAIARRIFDRWGRGGISAEMTLLRGGAGDSLKLGDEALFSLPQIPNHNYRLLDNGAIAGRAMQIVRRTVLPIGYAIKVVDSGVGGQPPATVATVAVAASADLPRTVAQVTITNAATLNAASYGARLQVAFTAGGAPAADQYTDVQAWRAGDVPTVAIRLPPVTAGTTIYVRARSEISGARPSAWGAAANVTLTGINAPTAFTATPDVTDGSKCALAWTIGAGGGSDWVDVWLRKNGEAFSAAAQVRTLDAGSNRFTLEGLVPGTAYIASVQHRDPRTQDVSAPVDAAFAAGGTVVTLTRPTGAVGFSESLGTRQSPKLTGIYGLAVEASAFPSLVEFQEAVETAAGAGTFGAYAKVGELPSVSGDFTVWSRIAPSDGKRRRLRARHIRDGATSSDWTSAATVSPWTYAPLSIAEADEGLNNFQPKDSADGLTRTFTMLAGVRVHRVAVFSLKLAVQSNVDPFPSADATKMAAWKAAGGVQDPVPLVPDPVTRIVTYTVTKPSANYQMFLQFEARLDDWTEGDIKRAVVDPAPSALTATLHDVVTNGTVDLSANVQAGLADWPVQVDFYADDPFGAVLATKTISANATLDKTSPGLAALGGLTLPLREVRKFWIKLTNVAGEVWLSDPISVDRIALPEGNATIIDYRAAPILKLDYLGTTTSVVFRMPGPRTKTFSGLSGSGTVSYTVGDAIDGGGAVENAFDLEETRTGYQIDVIGGGVTTTIWGGGLTGTLHGQVMGAIPQGTVSVNRNGDWSWTVDGPKDQHHVHYAESNSAFPSDATAAAGTNINGRQVTRSGGATLLRGQAIYVTIISYNAANVALQSIRLRGDFQDNAIPQGSVSIDADGAWGWAIDGPQFQASVTYAESTSAFPSDGTAAAGTVINGRQVSRTGGTALTFGQTKYVTIVPWTGSGGTGEQLPSIRLRGSYQTFTATKFDTFPGSSFVPRDSALTTVRTDPSVGTFIADPGSNPIKAQGSLSPRLSSGLTITSVSLYGMQTFSGGGTHRLVVDLHRITKSTQAFTSIAQAETDASSGAAQLVTTSGLSHTVDTDTYSYQMRLLLADSSSNSTALELWNVTVGYTQNNPSQGL